MERKQFTFTGLGWMTPEKIQELKKQFLRLEDYGIEFEIVMHHDVRLFIYDYDEVLLSRISDDNVTFLRKFQGYYGNETDEDSLLIFTINDDMEIKAKVLNYWGDAENINL